MIVKLLALALLLVLSSCTQIVQDRQVYNPNKKQLASTTPIKFIYIDVPTSWFGEDTIPAALGIPGFATPAHPYNYVCLAFWTYPSAAVDSAGVWANISSKMTLPTAFGSTTQEIQATLKQYYVDAGVKFMVSAFGSTQTPTTSKFDPIDTANQLAQFAIDNLFDGVDVDWQDTPSFQAGDRSGQDWLITFTKQLRTLLPNHIITHAPQAPYFAPYIQGDASLYPQGAYLTVDREAGSLIDFYNIQFYNQGKGVYDYAEGLFNISGGWAPETSINEIIANGVPQSKVVLGKPVTTKNAHSGWMSSTDLNNAIKANLPFNGWNTGVMFWQFKSDINGTFCNQVLAGVSATNENIMEAKE